MSFKYVLQQRNVDSKLSVSSFCHKMAQSISPIFLIIFLLQFRQKQNFASFTWGFCSCSHIRLQVTVKVRSLDVIHTNKHQKDHIQQQAGKCVAMVYNILHMWPLSVYFYFKINLSNLIINCDNYVFQIYFWQRPVYREVWGGCSRFNTNLQILS